MFALILDNFTRAQKYFTRSWQSPPLLPCQSSPSFPDKRIVTLRISMYYCEECNSLVMVLCWKIQKIISSMIKSPKSRIFNSQNRKRYKSPICKWLILISFAPWKFGLSYPSLSKAGQTPELLLRNRITEGINFLGESLCQTFQFQDRPQTKIRVKTYFCPQLMEGYPILDLLNIPPFCGGSKLFWWNQHCWEYMISLTDSPNVGLCTYFFRCASISWFQAVSERLIPFFYS